MESAEVCLGFRLVTFVICLAIHFFRSRLAGPLKVRIYQCAFVCKVKRLTHTRIDHLSIYNHQTPCITNKKLALPNTTLLKLSYCVIIARGVMAGTLQLSIAFVNDRA
jgi:hypothetical protein